MNKKTLLIFLSLFLVAVTLLTSCSGNKAGDKKEAAPVQAPQTIKLKLADSFPATHVISKEGAMYWANRVKELTKGQVEFEYYPAEQLGKAADLMDAVKNRVTDVGYVAPSYVSNKMPLSSVGMLPGFFTTCTVGTVAYWKVVEQYLEKEEFVKNGIRPIWAVTLAPYKISTNKAAIKSIGDIKGLKIRTGGATQEFMVKELGGISVSTPAPEIYTAMQRGTIDGSTGPYSSFKPYKMQEVVRHSATNSSVGSFIVTYSINEEVWGKLPDNVKNAMKEAGKDTMKHLSKVLDEEELKEQKSLEGFNVAMYTWSAEDVAKQTAAAKVVADMWAKKLDERGLGGSKTVELFVKALQ